MRRRSTPPAWWGYSSEHRREAAELRQELAKRLQSHYGLDYNPETELLITVGVSEALDLTMRAIINPGD